MSDLSERLRAHAADAEASGAFIAQLAIDDALEGAPGDATYEARCAGHHANLALDLREAADLLERMEPVKGCDGCRHIYVVNVPNYISNMVCCALTRKEIYGRHRCDHWEPKPCA